MRGTGDIDSSRGLSWRVEEVLRGIRDAWIVPFESVSDVVIFNAARFNANRRVSRTNWIKCLDPEENPCRWNVSVEKFVVGLLSVNVGFVLCVGKG